MDSRGPNWMSFLPDNLKLFNLTIPGTHNSCAYDCSPFAKCQKLSLIDQLNSGVRYLDVRCRQIEDQFRLYHGSFNLNLDFDSGCIDICIDFLRSNPSETLVMLVSTEHTPIRNNHKFDDVFVKYIENNKKHWYLQEDAPELGSARGKIVLLRRFFTTQRSMGIDMSGWRKGTFRIQNHANFQFSIQDDYKLLADEKWSKVKDLIEECKANLDGNQTWYMNYCSAQYWPIQPPKYIAWVVNKQLTMYINGENEFDEIRNRNKNSSLGILILDFAKPDFIKNIFSLNFI